MGSHWESKVNKGKVVMQTLVLPSSLIRVSCGLGSGSLLVQKDALTNGDFPYKCKCPSQKTNFYFVFRASVSVVSQK